MPLSFSARHLLLGLVSLAALSVPVSAVPGVLELPQEAEWILQETAPLQLDHGSFVLDVAFDETEGLIALFREPQPEGGTGLWTREGHRSVALPGERTEALLGTWEGVPVVVASVLAPTGAGVVRVPTAGGEVSWITGPEPRADHFAISVTDGSEAFVAYAPRWSAGAFGAFTNIVVVEARGEGARVGQPITGDITPRFEVATHDSAPIVLFAGADPSLGTDGNPAPSSLHAYAPSLAGTWERERITEGTPRFEVLWSPHTTSVVFAGARCDASVYIASAPSWQDRELAKTDCSEFLITLTGACAVGEDSFVSLVATDQEASRAVLLHVGPESTHLVTEIVSKAEPLVACSQENVHLVTHNGTSWQWHRFSPKGTPSPSGAGQPTDAPDRPIPGAAALLVVIAILPRLFNRTIR